MSEHVDGSDGLGDVVQGEEPPAIRPDDRVIAIGMTGSGKSTILGNLWAAYPGQRLLIDVNDGYELGPASLDPETGGGCKCENVAGIDWRARSIHLVPRSHSQQAYDDLYAAIWERAGHGYGICVWLDEAYGPTTPNVAPRWLRAAITQGRKRRILHLAATQEPVNVLPVLLSQANHMFCFQLGPRPDDLDRVARRFGWRGPELQHELAQLAQDEGRFGYLRQSLGEDPRVFAMPALDEAALRFTRRHVLMP